MSKCGLFRRVYEPLSNCLTCTCLIMKPTSLAEWRLKVYWLSLMHVSQIFFWIELYSFDSLTKTKEDACLFHKNHIERPSETTPEMISRFLLHTTWVTFIMTWQFGDLNSPQKPFCFLFLACLALINSCNKSAVISG
jgi:hypothetical protein